MVVIKSLSSYKDIWKQYRPLFALNLMAVQVMVGVGMIAPILPLFGRSFGVSTTMVGLLVTSFGLARLLTDLPAGMLAEKYGRRVIVAGGPLIMSLGAVLCVFSGSFWHLVAGQFVQGVGSAMYTTAAMTAVAEMSTSGNRGRAIASFQGCMLVGTCLGPGIGGLIAAFMGYRAAYAGYALLALSGALWVWFNFPETRPGKDVRKSRHFFGGDISPLSMLKDINFLLVMLINFSVFFTRSGAKVDLIPLVGAERVGLGPEQLGFTLSFIGISGIAMLPLAGWMSDRCGKKLTIVPANLISGIGLIFFAYCNNYLFFFIGVLMYGISSSLSSPASAAYLADIVPLSSYGTAMGLYRTFGDIGFVIAPVALGWLVDTGSFSLAFWVNALLVIASSLAFGLLAREDRKKSPPVSGTDTGA